MNFKEALIAHLQGEKVEARASQMDVPWKDFGSYHRCIRIQQIPYMENVTSIEYRLAPRTIKVNGVEVPAPEQAAPDYGATYYVPMPSWADFYAERRWDTSDDHIHSLKCGLVYLNKDDAINRSKAMLITQEAV